MKQLITLSILLSTIISATSCEQDETLQPPIRYVNLNNAITGYTKSFTVDIDQDGDTEFLFTTSQVADESGDKLQFGIYPARANQVFEIFGRVGVLEAGQEIAPGNPFDKNVQPMVIKSITNDETSWSGDWKDVSNKFIGIRFKLRDQAYYYGWIRVSFDQPNEQFIIHDLGYSPSLNLAIKAGEK